MNSPLKTYRALYEMALLNNHIEAIRFFKARILKELFKIHVEAMIDSRLKTYEREKALRAERIAAIRHRIAVNRERIQHHAAMTRAGFILKNGFYYAK